MRIFDWLSEWLNPFHKPTALTLAVDELQEAQRQLLIAQTSQEYSKALVQYNQERIKRLSSAIKSMTMEASQ